MEFEHVDSCGLTEWCVAQPRTQHFTDPGHPPVSSSLLQLWPQPCHLPLHPEAQPNLRASPILAASSDSSPDAQVARERICELESDVQRAVQEGREAEQGAIHELAADETTELRLEAAAELAREAQAQQTRGEMEQLQAAHDMSVLRLETAAAREIQNEAVQVKKMDRLRAAHDAAMQQVEAAAAAREAEMGLTEAALRTALLTVQNTLHSQEQAHAALHDAATKDLVATKESLAAATTQASRKLM